MTRRLTHTSNSGMTESSSSHQLTADEHLSLDDDVVVSFQGEDPLATESSNMVSSDSSGSTSSNTSKRKKSGRGPGKLPKPTAPTDRPLITPTEDCQWEIFPTKPPKRLLNHVIGSLVRKYFLGLAKSNDDDPPSPGFTWEHYQHTKDEHGVTMAARVIDGFHPMENWMKEDCWEALADMWCDPTWLAQHVEKGNKRAKIPSLSHVEGSRNLTILKQHMESELGRSVLILEAWKEGHKGKDGTEFCTQSVQERYETFIEVFQEVHGQDAEPTQST
ncbi:Glutamate decarboxylase 1 [Hordeum vulgare]|nr:Glutamate decarboxylase 1 [Hordeum vulgare]